MKACIVQPEFGEAFAQFLEIVRVGRIEAAPHHGNRGLEPGQRLGRRVAVLGDRVAHIAIGDRFDRGGYIADLAGSEIIDRDQLRAEDAGLFDSVHRAGRHHPDLLSPPEPPILDPHQDDHAEILVVPAIHQQGLERRVGVAFRRGQARDEGFQHSLDIEAGLGADFDRLGRVEPDHVLDLLLHPLRLGGGKVDLVQDRNDLVVRLDRLIDIGEGLRLHALAGIHD